MCWVTRTLPVAHTRPEIVASEVDEHEVLGRLLVAGAKLTLHARVVLGCAPSPPGAGDRVIADAALR